MGGDEACISGGNKMSIEIGHYSRAKGNPNNMVNLL